ncbi:hypothetical protein HDV00_000889 [Rhizophlyctis rosea]|nr:hypothetical protein HDV00_000889 [Rhizophlyctis rosea]
MATPKCINLDASTPCGPDFNSFPVVTAEFRTVANFTAEAQVIWQKPTELANDLIAGTGCTQGAAQNAVTMGALRYQLAYFCSSAVERALLLGCALPAARSMEEILCPAQCDTAASSVQDFFADTSVCPAVAATSASGQARAAKAKKIADFCTTYSSAKLATGARCFAGVPNEPCGYLETNTTAVCTRQKSTDSCCKNVLAGGSSSATISSATSTATATAGSGSAASATPTTATNGTSANNASSDSSSGNGTFPKVPVIVIFVIAIIMLAALAAFLVARRRRKQAELKEAGVFKNEGGGGAPRGLDEKGPRPLDVPPPMFESNPAYVGSQDQKTNPFNDSTTYPPPPSTAMAGGGSGPGGAHRGTPQPNGSVSRSPAVGGAAPPQLDNDEDQWLVGGQQSMGRGGRDADASSVGTGGGKDAQQIAMAAVGAAGVAAGAVAAGQQQQGTNGEQMHAGQGPNADLNSLLGLKHAVYDYVPNMSDEIEIFVGDPILITEAFEDGWVFGRNLRSGAAGMLPLVIVEAQPTPPDRQSLRASRTVSMYRLSSLGYGTMGAQDNAGTLTRALGQGR